MKGASWLMDGIQFLILMTILTLLFSCENTLIGDSADSGSGDSAENTPPRSPGITISNSGEWIVGQELSFKGTSEDPDGEIVSYDWDFGDGNTAKGQEVTYAYSSAGTYEIKLEVTDDDGATASHTTLPNSIDPKPDNDPEPDPNPPDDVEGLSATRAHESVLLTWTVPSDVEWNQIVVRWEAESQSQQTLDRIEERYRVTGLSNRVSYDFTVFTVDEDGTESAGKSISATPQSPIPGEWSGSLDKGSEYPLNIVFLPNGRFTYPESSVDELGDWTHTGDTVQWIYDENHTTYTGTINDPYDFISGTIQFYPSGSGVFSISKISDY